MKIKIAFQAAAVTLLFSIALFIAAFAFSAPVRAAVTGRFVQGTTQYLTAGTGTGTAAGAQSATTTKVYLTAGATASSTVTGLLSRGDRVDFDVRAIASSSQATLGWTIETSDSLTSGDWYPVDEATTTIAQSNSVIHNTGPVTHLWNLATSSGTCGTNEVCKHFSIKDISGSYFRISFGMNGTTSAGGGNAGVWVRANVREYVPN